MFRQRLPEDRGMLFDFGEPRPVSMWMKNTYIPLDMLFIRADGTIAYIAENTVPKSLDTIGISEPVLAVLELAGGTARKTRHPGRGHGLSPDVQQRRVSGCLAGLSLAPGKHYRIRGCPSEGRYRGVAQSGSAPALGAGGRQFESGHPDHGLPARSTREKRAHARPHLQARPQCHAVRQGASMTTGCWNSRPRRPRTVDPLMGWTSSGDTRQQVKLTFDTKEEAIAYCEREGLAYQVLPEAPVAKVIKKSYSDNFKFGRSVNWTH